MTSPFTPKRILLKERRARLALFLVIVFTPTILFNLSESVYAEETVTYNLTTSTDGAMSDTVLTSEGVQLAVTASTSDETFDDFAAGDNFSDPFAMTSFPQEGGVDINQGYSYTTQTSPGLADDNVYHTFFSGNLLYISTQGGLSVINTQGTETAADDTLVTRYYTGSTPALGDNRIYYTFLNGNFLYISTEGGLSVINTQGTETAADDTLVTRYHTGSTPVLASNQVRHAFLDDNLLYVSTYNGGLSVINTQGTETAADDTLVTRYHTGSTPALAHNNVMHTLLQNNLLYISTWNGGLSVINTQGTETAADDTLVTSYHTGSTPVLASNQVRHAFLDDNLLYVSTYNGGLSVINTQGTETAADDTLVTRYHIGSTPALSHNYVRHASIYGNFLYVSTARGLSVVNTQGTETAADDTLVTRYHTESTPALSNTYILNTFLNNNDIYASTYIGLSVITPEIYSSTGTYLSDPRFIATTPTTTMALEGNTSVDQAVSLSYRTGSSEATYFNDFDDSTTTEYLGDWGGWGSSFLDAEESGGTMKLSDPDPFIYTVSGVDFWLDTGYSASHFAIDSVVTARVRINSNTRQQTQGVSEWMFSHDWWDDNGGQSIPNNQWVTMRLTASSIAFSQVGFEIVWNNGTWSPADTFEIDWIKITTPDSMGEWGSWNTCSGSTCVLPDLGTDAWLQYKLDLSTDDTATSPRVNKVTYQGDYESTGTYTSDTTTFGSERTLGTFTPSATIPTGTTVSYEYSVDEGGTWTTVTPGENIEEDKVNSFTWRATLTTADPAYTPSIESVTLTHTPYKPNISTSLQTQIDRLEANGNQEAIARLKAKYPQAFDGTATDHEIQLIIVGLLQEAVGYLNILVAKDAEES